MRFKQHVTPTITISDAPTPQDLEQLARSGYRTIIDLRTSDEAIPEDVLAPGEEARQARNAGLTYLNVPVKLSEVNDTLIEGLGVTLASTTGPVLVHCAAGKRAGALVLMNVGAQAGMTAEQCLTHAKTMGFDCDSEPVMVALVTRYLNTHSAAYQNEGEVA